MPGDEHDEKKSKSRQRRMSTASSQMLPAPAQDNTYYLYPPRKFNHVKAAPLVQQMLDETFMERQYNPLEARRLCRDLSHNVRIKMTNLMYRRYKIVVYITAGQKTMQPGFFAGSRCLWYPEFDNFVTASFESPEIFAFLVVFFVNYE